MYSYMAVMVSFAIFNNTDLRSKRYNLSKTLGSTIIAVQLKATEEALAEIDFYPIKQPPWAGGC